MAAFTTDPILASAHVRDLCERVRSFDRALKVGPAALDPFRGQTTIGKTWREELRASSDFAPIRQPLIGYLDRLLERRLNLGVSLEESAALTQDRHPPRTPFNLPGTLSERRQLALAASADVTRKEEAREAWRGLRAEVVRLSAVRVLRYERLLEIEERLGTRLSPAVAFDAEPGKSEAASAEAETSGVERLANLVLDVTEEPAQGLLDHGWAGLVEGATAAPAVDGWPARLGPDALLALFGGSWLVTGRGPQGTTLPLRSCPASFSRAAVQWGLELARAATPETLPFVLARSPSELHGRMFGRLLATWLWSPVCARRRLGLSASGRARHALGAARLLAAEMRLLAARALLAEAGRHSRGRLERAWDNLGVRLCGDAWGPPLGLLSAPPDAAADLSAQLWALARQAELVATWDEDYLDNPRAREALLSELHGTEPALPAWSTLESAALDLARTLGSG